MSAVTSHSYQNFLASKALRSDAIGQQVSPDDCHDGLHDWQRLIVAWSVRRGRCAVFADTGLGKTRMQLEWSRLIGETVMIVAPLSVARQTVREAEKIGDQCVYVRHPEEVTGPGLWITNYEMVGQFDPIAFDAVALDESSILKNFTGATRNALIQQWKDTKYRSSWSATPAPNDVTELCNQAEFLGIMPRNEMLAAYFIHDDDGWRLKGHAAGPMFEWMATWATTIRKPSDIGGDDHAYELPPLRIAQSVIDFEHQQDGQMFATDLGGVGGRHKVRKETLAARAARATEFASSPGQWIVWCGLNDEANYVATHVEGAVNVEGSMSPEDKAHAFEQFQDGAIRVLVTKPSIAGMGMNFQNCHQMVFLGLSDSWESYYQAIRRCWRFGQRGPVDVTIVVSPLEQQIVENVRSKESEVADWTRALIDHTRKGYADEFTTALH
jgi:hypothetical protein